ncbi:MAG: DUF1963 domain-containing protein [Caulobacteraceae bacterium]|nr:DUF1963 domain-containing protein [Caulobacteraceae bacterium]
MGITKFCAAIGVTLALFATGASAQQTDPVVRARIETFLNQMSRPGIAIVRGMPTPNITGNSWFGGLPRMPAELQWPSSTLTSAPMFFVAQIDLDDLPAIADRQGLPEQGVLWFFLAYDGVIEERERVAVLYDPRSGVRWPERPAPPHLGRIIDEGPYLYLDADDPLARLDLPRPMRFATIPTYALSAQSWRANFQPMRETSPIPPGAPASKQHLAQCVTGPTHGKSSTAPRQKAGPIPGSLLNSQPALSRPPYPNSMRAVSARPMRDGLGPDANCERRSPTKQARINTVGGASGLKRPPQKNALSFAPGSRV